MLAGAAGWIAHAAPERAVHPHALVPLYVRRPDVEIARDRRHAAGQAADARRTTASDAGADADIDAIVALETESFTNPWSRDTLVWELRNSDVTQVYVLRDDHGVVAGLLRRAG